MHSKPIVAINADFRSAKKDTPALCWVPAGYFDTIQRAGGIPMILPPMDSAADLARALDLVDAVMLSGGNDLDPRRDGYMLHPSMRLMESRRETFDRQLVKLAADKRLPVLGIGAGMQLLNVAQGGNLLFHIPEDVTKALPHKDPLDAGHRHALEVVPGTLMETVYGEGEIRVNSSHHMAVDEVAPDFLVSARSPDGVVEAIECQRLDWWAVGVQFHPESDSASALDQRIFEEFILAAVRRKEAVQTPVRLKLVA